MAKAPPAGESTLDEIGHALVPSRHSPVDSAPDPAIGHAIVAPRRLLPVSSVEQFDIEPVQLLAGDRIGRRHEPGLPCTGVDLRSRRCITATASDDERGMLRVAPPRDHGGAVAPARGRPPSARARPGERWQVAERTLVTPQGTRISPPGQSAD